MADIPTLEVQLTNLVNRIGLDIGQLKTTLGNVNDLEAIEETNIITALVNLSLSSGSGGVTTLEVLNICQGMIDRNIGNPAHDFLTDYEAAKTSAQTPVEA